MATGDREFYFGLAAWRDQQKARTAQAVGFNVARRDVRRAFDAEHSISDVATHPSHSRDALIVGVKHGDTIGLDARDQFGFRSGDAVYRIKELKMRRRNHRDDAAIGRRNASEPCDFALVIHAHLEDRVIKIISVCAVAFHLQNRQRQAVVVVQVARRLDDATGSVERRSDHFFGRRLAHAAGDGDLLPAPTTQHGRSKLLQCREGIVYANQHRLVIAQAVGLRELKITRHDGSDSALVQHVGDELMAVVMFAANGKEHIAGANRARVNRVTEWLALAE